MSCIVFATFICYINQVWKSLLSCLNSSKMKFTVFISWWYHKPITNTWNMLVCFENMLIWTFSLKFNYNKYNYGQNVSRIVFTQATSICNIKYYIRFCIRTLQFLHNEDYLYFYRYVRTDTGFMYTWDKCT